MRQTQIIRERINGNVDHILMLVPRFFTASQFITAFEKIDHEGYEFALQNANSYNDLNKWIGKHVIPHYEGSRIRRTNRIIRTITENGNVSRNEEWHLL